MPWIGQCWSRIWQRPAHVRKQRELFAKMERDGHDATEARKPLARFEDLLAMHKEDRDRLEKELAAG